MKCPSYTMGCKMRNMPSILADMMKGLDKQENFEGLYCAFKKSKCISNKKGCVCKDCSVFKENPIENLYYCTTTDGE